MKNMIEHNEHYFCMEGSFVFIKGYVTIYLKYEYKGKVRLFSILKVWLNK